MIAALIPSRDFRLSVILLLLITPMLAKDLPLQVIDWPGTGTPALRYPLERPSRLGAADRESAFCCNFSRN